MKRNISVLLSVILIFTFLFGASPACAAQKTSGKCGTDVRYSLNKKTGVLTISGKGKMKDYSSDWDSKIISPFSNFINDIKKVEIKKGVTRIGAYAFSDCRKIKNVSLPQSIVSIGEGAFEGCSALSEIRLPNGIKVIPTGCFSGCKKLKSVKLPSRLTSIEASAFSSCTALNSIKLPKTLKHIRAYVFSGCGNLKEIKIPKSCIADSYAFDCSGITYAEFANGSRLIDNRVFYQSDISSVYIPKSIRVIWMSSFHEFGVSDIYYQGNKKDAEKIDILDCNNEETGFPCYNCQYDSLSKLGRVYYNTSPSLAIPSLKSVKKGKSSITIKIKKQNSSAGYEVEYWNYYNWKFHKKSSAGTSFTIKKLKKGKQYCYRIRQYKKVNGKKLYSRWSKIHTVKL